VAKQFTLGKEERLKSRKQIEQLFSEGKKFTIPPFRIHYMLGPTPDASLQFGAGVSSKLFKKAKDRNRIKRLIREAYRLQKKALQKKINDQGQHLHVFVIYTGKELPAYKEIYEKISKVLDKLDQLLPVIK
jgi:ribonuclease P protein component